MQGQRWSSPCWQRLAGSSLWQEGVEATRTGRELPSDYLRVYLLIDPEMFVVRYVGITGKAVEERLKAHLQTAKHGSTYRDKWIRALSASPIAVEVMQLEEPIAFVAEQALIYTMTSMGLPLTNTHAGGGGFDAKGEDVRERQIAGIKAAWERGSYSAESRSRASKNAWTTRRKRLASGELQPQQAWNKGKKLDTGARISAGKLKGKRPQPELVQLVADTAKLSYAQTYRSLKGTGTRPPQYVVDAAWDAYEQLDDEVKDLCVKQGARVTV